VPKTILTGKLKTGFYLLMEFIENSIGSSFDFAAFGNQLAHNDVDELVEIIYSQVKNGAISYKRILESNRRIENLHTKNAIIQRAIDFTYKRKEMTRAYVKQHYGFNINNITINAS